VWGEFRVLACADTLARTPLGVRQYFFIISMTQYETQMKIVTLQKDQLLPDLKVILFSAGQCTPYYYPNRSAHTVMVWNKLTISTEIYINMGGAF
jgi:hypothetical protein